MRGLSKKILRSNSNNAVIVAMDHGIFLGACEKFENPAITLDKVLEGDPDGIIAGPNFFRYFQDRFMAKPHLKKIVTIDFAYSSTIPGKDEKLEIQDQAFTIKRIAKSGTDAVKTLLIFGREDPRIFSDNVKYVTKISEEAQELGIPLVVEPTLWGKKIGAKHDPELIKHSVRIAFEIGADIIKAPYTGKKETFAPIVRNSPVPIFILGGPKMKTVTELLETVEGAMSAGARGVMFGRNIWQHYNPGKLIESIKLIVHGDASVEQALKVLST